MYAQPSHHLQGTYCVPIQWPVHKSSSPALWWTFSYLYAVANDFYYTSYLSKQSFLYFKTLIFT